MIFQKLKGKMNYREIPVVQECSMMINLIEKNNYNEWNIILNSLDENNIIPSKNNPKFSGQYLCTCVAKSKESTYKYLCILEYNANKNYWHDVGNPNGLNHIILAWKEQNVCPFDDFEYKEDGLFKK